MAAVAEAVLKSLTRLSFESAIPDANNSEMITLERIQMNDKTLIRVHNK